MTVVAALSIAGAVVGVFGGLFAWVVNRTIFSRLDALETARGAQAERFGEGIGGLRAGHHDLDKRLAILEDRQERMS